MPARRALIPTAIFTAFAVVLVASFAFFRHRSDEDNRQRSSASAAAAQASLRLRDFVTSRLLALQTLVPQLQAGRLADRDSFASAATALYVGFPGFQAINWVEPGGTLLWVNPPEPNRAALGKSVFEHPQAGTFARRAAGGTELVLTGPLDLFQGMRGFVAYVPVVVDGELLGLVNGVFSVELLVQGALETGLLDEYQLRVTDQGDSLFASPGFAAAAGDGRPVGLASVDVAGREWRLEVMPGDALWANIEHSHAPLLIITLILAAALAILVSIALAAQHRQKRLQLELQQATKMESVGRLAGGVAHDFNNLLTAMTSYATLLRCSDELPASLVADVDEILATAARGAALTRQLLTFARKETSESSQVDVGALLRGMKKLLRRVLRADIQLSLRVSRTAGTCFIDANQLEQTILNLCINSIDAMPHGGTLTVAADRHARDGGDFCRIVVRDTGVGMAPEVADKVFDPFFTTKPVGKGTGLGLSSVYGLVTSAGGTVSLHSEPGVGTAFTILLPRTGDGAFDDDSAVTPLPNLGPTGGERARGTRVLLVEDEKSVRRASTRILERGGLEVVAVADGVEAMTHLAEDKREFDVIVSDVVMPRMGGLELVERLRAAGVSVPVLLCSGYNDQDLDAALLDRLGCDRLEKPFAPTELLARVEHLTSGAADAGAGPVNSTT